MDVPPCNPLLDLWFVALVLSRTLNRSSERKCTNEELKRPVKSPAFLFSAHDMSIHLDFPIHIL